jgi:cellulose synthase/poly-beta-1,6-N-acetylglucosamine synthase-like glycosyltransferase
MMPALDVLLTTASVPFAVAGAYLATLALAARHTLPPHPSHAHRFDVIVPGHDEEQGIGATLTSLRMLDYPPERYRVIVVADNCADATAARARDAGAFVLERRDPSRRGKGYALAHAFEASLADGFADAIAVVDADSSVSPNLLTAISARLERGTQCVQAEYGIRNPDASWRTRLMAVAFALYHTLRSLGRERLGFSCGLRGNGMAFSTALLRRVPLRAFSPVEDVEYGLMLGLHGVRVGYVAEATVLGDMPRAGAGARLQRDRWERGRRSLRREYVPSLLRASVCRRDRIPLELAADLMIPPLTRLTSIVATGTTAVLALYSHAYVSAVSAAGWSVAAAGVLVYVWRGWLLSGASARGLLDLVWVPVYIAWKLSLVFSPSRAAHGEWVRTKRTV